MGEADADKTLADIREGRVDVFAPESLLSQDKTIRAAAFNDKIKQNVRNIALSDVNTGSVATGQRYLEEIQALPYEGMTDTDGVDDDGKPVQVPVSQRIGELLTGYDDELKVMEERVAGSGLPEEVKGEAMRALQSRRQSAQATFAKEEARRSDVLAVQSALNDAEDIAAWTYSGDEDDLKAHLTSIENVNALMNRMGRGGQFNAAAAVERAKTAVTKQFQESEVPQWQAAHRNANQPEVMSPDFGTDRDDLTSAFERSMLATGASAEEVAYGKSIVVAGQFIDNLTYMFGNAEGRDEQDKVVALARAQLNAPAMRARLHKDAVGLVARAIETAETQRVAPRTGRTGAEAVAKEVANAVLQGGMDGGTIKVPGEGAAISDRDREEWIRGTTAALSISAATDPRLAGNPLLVDAVRDKVKNALQGMIYKVPPLYEAEAPEDRQAAIAAGKTEDALRENANILARWNNNDIPQVFFAERGEDGQFVFRVNSNNAMPSPSFFDEDALVRGAEVSAKARNVAMELYLQELTTGNRTPLLSSNQFQQWDAGGLSESAAFANKVRSNLAVMRENEVNNALIPPQARAALAQHGVAVALDIDNNGRAISHISIAKPADPAQTQAVFSGAAYALYNAAREGRVPAKTLVAHMRRQGNTALTDIELYASTEAKARLFPNLYGLEDVLDEAATRLNYAAIRPTNFAKTAHENATARRFFRANVYPQMTQVLDDNGQPSRDYNNVAFWKFAETYKSVFGTGTPDLSQEELSVVDTLSDLRGALILPDGQAVELDTVFDSQAVITQSGRHINRVLFDERELSRATAAHVYFDGEQTIITPFYFEDGRWKTIMATPSEIGDEDIRVHSPVRFIYGTPEAFDNPGDPIPSDRMFPPRGL